MCANAREILWKEKKFREVIAQFGKLKGLFLNLLHDTEALMSAKATIETVKDSIKGVTTDYLSAGCFTQKAVATSSSRQT